MIISMDTGYHETCVVVFPWVAHPEHDAELPIDGCPCLIVCMYVCMCDYYVSMYLCMHVSVAILAQVFCSSSFFSSFATSWGWRHRFKLATSVSICSTSVGMVDRLKIVGDAQQRRCIGDPLGTGQRCSMALFDDSKYSSKHHGDQLADLSRGGR